MVIKCTKNISQLYITSKKQPTHIIVFTIIGPHKHQSAVTCLQFDSKFVVTSSDDGTVKLWDVKTGNYSRPSIKDCNIMQTEDIFTSVKQVYCKNLRFQVTLFETQQHCKVEEVVEWCGGFELVPQSLYVLSVQEMAPKKPSFQFQISMHLLKS